MITSVCRTKERPPVGRCASALRGGLVFVGVIIALDACDASRTVTADTGLTAVSVRVRAPANLAALALALNWPPGDVPGAMVIVSDLSGNASVADTAVTDAAGAARFLLPFGAYKFDAARTLTDAEQATIGDALGGASALTGVFTAEVGATAEYDVGITLVPVDRGTLVFSEIFPSSIFNASGTALYYFADYVKVYNNSDTTIALAGKLFINAFPGWHEFSATANCAMFAQLMRDPEGIWAQYVYRFPPSAPVLAPGAAAVLATDAIDHRPLGGGAPGFTDLSRADFEFRGSADVDNPLVPDMISVGPLDGGTGLRHGWQGSESRPVLALAAPLDFDTLPTVSSVLSQGVPWVRVPVAALLDVVTHAFTDPGGATPCRSSVVPEIDAAEAHLLLYNGSVAMHRKVSRVLPGGRVILQRTRNSAADWKVGPQTPFGVP